jgi:hypothetical protein
MAERPWRRIDLSGSVYGKLTAIHPLPHSCGERIKWLCRCECGNEMITTGHNLRTGHTRSCGCLGGKFKPTRGGVSRNPATKALYHIWHGMIVRCTDPRDKKYHLYGGRGITVHPQWMDSFDTFKRDVGDRPSDEHSLDRFPNNNGNYEPGNVRWATRLEQSSNSRRIIPLTINGITKSISQWARVSPVTAATISDRYTRRKWTAEAAVFTPRQAASATD